MSTVQLESLLEHLLAAHWTQGLSKSFVDKHYLLCKCVEDPRVALGIHIVKASTMDVRLLTPTVRVMYKELRVFTSTAFAFINALEAILCHMETQRAIAILPHFCNYLKPFSTSAVIHLTRKSVLCRYTTANEEPSLTSISEHTEELAVAPIPP